tara:strand:+ start:5030 stop:5269 length:240 start_codon:yes stop_codon:yes gene_type:complete
MTPIFTVLDLFFYTLALGVGWYCITMYEALKPPKGRSIFVLSDGETWDGEAVEVNITDKQYDRLLEGEKVSNVLAHCEE